VGAKKSPPEERTNFLLISYLLKKHIVDQWEGEGLLKKERGDGEAPLSGASHLDFGRAGSGAQKGGFKERKSPKKRGIQWLFSNSESHFSRGAAGEAS